VRTVRMLEEASQEAVEAAAWYEYEQPGLGVDFFAALEKAFDIIEENLVPLSPFPEIFSRTGAKRLILGRFPYDIVVVEQEDEAVIIAVAHHSRKPGYWRERDHRING
jgi:toxin ParE1/3/4